jgi:hypothetical protein
MWFSSDFPVHFCPEAGTCPAGQMFDLFYVMQDRLLQADGTRQTELPQDYRWRTKVSKLWQRRPKRRCDEAQSKMNRTLCLASFAVLLLAGCARLPTVEVAQLMEPDLVKTRGTPPPGSDPNACFGQDATPAVIETVTVQIMLQPAQISADGTVQYPAVYKTETRQAIVEERRELWFETPCSNQLTPDFVASVQRALKARGAYRGPVDGIMSARTRHAIRAYQKPQGLDSAILSKAAARQLGLVAYGAVPDSVAASIPYLSSDIGANAAQ